MLSVNRLIGVVFCYVVADNLDADGVVIRWVAVRVAFGFFMGVQIFYPYRVGDAFLQVHGIGGGQVTCTATGSLVDTFGLQPAYMVGNLTGQCCLVNCALFVYQKVRSVGGTLIGVKGVLGRGCARLMYDYGIYLGNFAFVEAFEYFLGDFFILQLTVNEFAHINSLVTDFPLNELVWRALVLWYQP